MEAKSSFLVSNPWVAEDRSTAAVRHAIRLAERSGHLRTNREEKVGELTHSLEVNSPSLHLIRQLKEMTARGQELDKLNLDIQCRLMDKETRGITHLSSLEAKISELDALTEHLQSVIRSKDQLLNRLQKPFLGDHLKVEAAYHRHVKELFPLASSCLAQLSGNLATVQWASGFDAKDGKMDETLDGITTSLAHLQTSFQAICQLRGTLDKFEVQDSTLAS